MVHKTKVEFIKTVYNSDGEITVKKGTKGLIDPKWQFFPQNKKIFDVTIKGKIIPSVPKSYLKMKNKVK